ncbi:MAG TPA: CocE/NonD family hydrolase, partial [Candidatus Limnocylindrales bacterium]
MTVETVRFYSHGAAVAGTLKLPDGRTGDERVPAVVQGPGWLGLREAKVYEPYHDVLLAEGVAVLVFDYRGFGDSEGDATYLDPMAQVEDYRSAASYLQTRTEIDPNRLGAFGSGGTGGGNAIIAAGIDDRFKVMVSQVPISDGREWLH